jgi:hypothetical protein
VFAVATIVKDLIPLNVKKQKVQKESATITKPGGFGCDRLYQHAIKARGTKTTSIGGKSEQGPKPLETSIRDFVTSSSTISASDRNDRTAFDSIGFRCCIGGHWLFLFG